MYFKQLEDNNPFNRQLLPDHNLHLILTLQKCMGGNWLGVNCPNTF